MSSPLSEQQASCHYQNYLSIRDRKIFNELYTYVATNPPFERADSKYRKVSTIIWDARKLLSKNLYEDYVYKSEFSPDGDCHPLHEHEYVIMECLDAILCRILILQPFDDDSDFVHLLLDEIYRAYDYVLGVGDDDV